MQALSLRFGRKLISIGIGIIEMPQGKPLYTITMTVKVKIAEQKTLTILFTQEAASQRHRSIYP
jgi:hypothetical protein